jgi:D-alanyl-D-alanine dipeptidase
MMGSAREVLMSIQDKEPLLPVEAVAEVPTDMRLGASPDADPAPLFVPGAEALLREGVALRLGRVAASLRGSRVSLRVIGAYRPASVQARLASSPAGDPCLGGPADAHARGAAVDVVLCDASGFPFEVPDRFRSPGEQRPSLPGLDRDPRQVLRGAMEREGFVASPHAWWHFVAPDAETYAVLDLPPFPTLPED